MIVNTIFGIFLFAIIVGIVIYGLMIAGILPGFESLSNIFGNWSARLFSPV